MNPENEPTTEETVAPETQEAESSQESWQLSKQDWETVVGGLHYLTNQYQQLAQPQQPQEEEVPDFENMDAADIVQHYVDSRLGELEPYVATAAKEAGEKRMNELFDQHEKDPEIGKFDRRLASRVAESLYTETGDPVVAVREAARMVSGMSKAERQAAVEEYKASLQRSSFQDPGITGSGERTPLPAKSYDEVIARWSGQEDV